MQQLLFIAAGGAGGAVARYLLANWVHGAVPHAMPWGTLLVNVLGSFCIGVLYVLIAEKLVLHPNWSSVLMVGFLGAFTTFSTFSLETVVLLDKGQTLLAAGYMLASVSVCVAAAAAAIAVTRSL